LIVASGCLASKKKEKPEGQRAGSISGTSVFTIPLVIALLGNLDNLPFLTGLSAAHGGKRFLYHNHILTCLI